MAGLQALFLAFVTLAGAGPDAPRIDPTQFMTWFDAAMDGRLVLSKQTMERSYQYRYVFIAGFHNELMPGYFSQNAKELRAIGVSPEAIHVVYPSSDNSVEENRASISKILHDLAAKGPQPLVIIAHSRGACDAMAFALHEPAFVQQRVNALFMVQGAFGGTGLADFILEGGESLERLTPAQRMLCKTIAKVERGIHQRGSIDGLPDMMRDAAKAYWQKKLAEQAASIPIIEPKIFYIQSEAETARLRILQRATGRYLSTHFGPNDGVVASEDQGLPGVGQIIATLDVGHADLTRKGFATRAGKRARQALVRSVVAAIAKPSDAERDRDVSRAAAVGTTFKKPR